MEFESRESGRWQWNVIITLGVVSTVLLALLLAQLDTTPPPIPPTPLVLITDITIIAPSQTPLPAIPLVSVTPTTTSLPTLIPTTTSPLPEECGAVPTGWIPTTVRVGENVMALAIRSGTSVATMIRANCLRQDMLMPGMIIYLPPTPPTRQPCGPPAFWVQYVVQAGDTMFTLALRHGTSVYAIITANCLSSSELRVGQVIFLPPLRLTATPPATPLPSPTEPSPTERPSATLLPPPTSTPIPATATPVPATNTAVPPTVTPSATPTKTMTAMPPTVTNTPSQTPVSPTPTETATVTAVPPTDTPTLPPPTDTPTLPPPTDTPTPPPPTDTSTPPPTDTPTAVPSPTP